MTHRIILTIALFLSLTSAQAQFSVGFSGGANFTFWEWHIKSLHFGIDYDPGLSARAAMQAEYQFSPAFSLRAELTDQIYRNNLTAEVTDPNGNSNGNSNGKASRIPSSYNTVGGGLLAKFSPLKKQRNLYLITGPALAYITHGWQRFSGGLVEGHDKPWNKRIDLDEEQIRRAQWLADFGLGYTLSFREKNHLAVEFRYQYGLSGLTESPNIRSGFQSTLLSFGYLWGL